MSVKKILGLIVLAVAIAAVLAVVVALILVRVEPSWYQPRERSPEELVAAEEEMLRTTVAFNNASQVAEPFILELRPKQINDMIAVVINRQSILPNYVRQPFIYLDEGAIIAAALVSWKGQTSVVSIRIRPFVDSAGLLHAELDKLKAGALGLPENFLKDTLDKLERGIDASLERSRSDSERARTARKNKDLLARIFTALHGAPVPANFVTREDLQMAIEDVRVGPELLEIQFRPIATGESEEIYHEGHEGRKDN